MVRLWDFNKNSGRNGHHLASSITNGQEAQEVSMLSISCSMHNMIYISPRDASTALHSNTILIGGPTFAGHQALLAYVAYVYTA